MFKQDRLKAPEKIVGPEAAGAYAQLRAQRDLKALLESDKKGAGAKAFSAGFAAGGLGTFMLSAVPEMFQAGARRSEVQMLQDEARLAKYLMETRGLDEVQARLNAAGVMQLLHREGSGTFSDLARSLMAEAGGKTTGKGATDTVGMDAVLQHKKRFAPLGTPKQAFDTLTSGGRAEHTFKAFGASPEGKGKLLDMLRRRYKPDMSDTSAHLRVLARRLEPAAVGALPFAVFGGIEAYRANQAKRREVQTLARTA